MGMNVNRFFYHLSDHASASFEFLIQNDNLSRRNRCIDGFNTWICNEHVYLVFDGFGLGEYFYSLVFSHSRCF
jgi:hypothetical protein